MQRDEIKNELDLNSKKLEEERAILNKLAQECLNAGKSISNEPRLFNQARIVDDLVINDEKLGKVLEEIDE